MSNEGFFRRWSRLKSHGEVAQAESGQGAPSSGRGPGSPARAPAAEGAGTSLQRADDLQALDLPAVAQTAPHPPFAPAQPEAAARRLPTIEDVAALGPDSDFSAFVSQGVDKTVQRLAMKKLFSDPHFSVLDGLDVYIDDYTKADPIPAAMLASLEHAKSVFARLVDGETGKTDGQGGDGSSAAPRPGNGDDRTAGPNADNGADRTAGPKAGDDHERTAGPQTSDDHDRTAGPSSDDGNGGTTGPKPGDGAQPPEQNDA